MILHLSSGRGPAECQLAVAKLVTALKRECPLEVLAQTDGRFAGCLKSALIRTERIIPDLVGTVLWVCRSPYRPKHKRKNWFVGVSVIEEPRGCDYTCTGGIVYQTFRAGGAGGQHVNVTETAVRAIHAATGLSAVAQDERSQYQNRRTATERLKALLEAAAAQAALDGRAVLQADHDGLVRGQPVRVYEGLNFRRVEGGVL